ncbi:hypothetical protein SAMN05421835_111158 [Amycolatopsis sacchari]|uniref:Uncharacterized protein n=1 Tax=Amycolatopsis sacchari TaxID=115433 RepID=A0A1I3VT47_9PSEU|nr:hypothetical protein [Amycolatopsis sacchari]SFJ97467.1 hypothetical protein SAMN05421835_111158 [Amycolatopsis sacchari]
MTEPSPARRRAAEKIFAHEERLAAQRYEREVRPGFRERVEELMRGEWGEPVAALRLGDTSLGFEVPGRRLDGTVKGRKLVRRFFWNILRGVAGGAWAVFALVNGAGSGGGRWGSPFEREIRVKGPANALALDLADPLRSVKGPWLVLSRSAVAVVDSGSAYLDPADAAPLRIIWQARKPQAPEVDVHGRTITWPDGSTFRFPLHSSAEAQRLR